MSKIGKKPIEIPTDVTMKRDVLKGRDVLQVKGPKGEISINILSFVELDIQAGSVQVSTKKLHKQARANWGTMASLIKNAIYGVSHGFAKTLVFEGVGFRAQLKGKALELNVGYSHPVVYDPVSGVEIATEKNTITVSGVDKLQVGQAAAEIRKIRKPEPYKGSGIRYENEVIKRKAGKKAAGATTQ
jgi:large subunit ribosomal protein L6